MSLNDVNTLADARALCPHLLDREWTAIFSLAEAVGEEQALLLLKNNGPSEHQRLAFNVILRENVTLKDNIANR